MLDRHRLNLLAGALMLSAGLIGYSLAAPAPAVGAQPTMTPSRELKHALAASGLLAPSAPGFEAR